MKVNFNLSKLPSILLALTTVIVSSVNAFAIDSSSEANIAKDKSVTVSSNFANAGRITDADDNRGWQAKSDAHKNGAPDWALIDLGNSDLNYNFIEILWEASHPSEYSVYFLNEVPTFSTVNERNIISADWFKRHSADVVRTISGQSNYTDEIGLATSQKARYILIFANQYNGFADSYGSNIFEVRVSDNPAVNNLSYFKLSCNPNPVPQNTPVTLSVEGYTMADALIKNLESKAADLSITASPSEGIEISKIPGQFGKYNLLCSSASPYTITVSASVDGQEVKENISFSAYAPASSFNEISDLYLVGAASVPNKAVRDTNGKKFTFKNVYFTENSNSWFYFRVNANDDNAARIFPSFEGSDVRITDETPLPFIMTTDYRNHKSYVAYKGFYDVIVDFSDENGVGYVKIVPNQDHYVTDILSNAYFEFWEGPIFNKVNERGGSAFLYKGKQYRSGSNNRSKPVYVWEYKVADASEAIKAIEYASQMKLFVYVNRNVENHHEYKYNPETKKFDLEVEGSEIKPAFNSDIQGMIYFDAHSTNTLIPTIKDDFWCSNSRMEVGLKVRSIFLVYDPNPETNAETPFSLMLSEDGQFNEYAQEQIPFNSQHYSLELTKGAVYDAVKGSMTEKVTIPFIRHHLANEGYSINLGKRVTVTDPEEFNFLVNDKVYNGTHFVLNTVYRDGDEDNYMGARGINNTNVIDPEGQELTFSKIVLLVNIGDDNKYSDYQIYLVDGEEPDQFYVNGYTDGLISADTQKNPMLKIWRGNDYAWTELLEQARKSTGEDSDDTLSQNIPYTQDGNAFYFEFKPVTSKVLDEFSIAKKTNIYYLDLYNNGEGVDIRDVFEYVETNEDGSPKRHHKKSCQFNIVDNSGYDISTPFQGSQVIYPDEWWCANPSLGFKEIQELKQYFPNLSDSDIRKKDGYVFPPLDRKVKDTSVVDLAWGTVSPNVRAFDNENTSKRIYGITLFKIMGSGYDVYAEEVRERPLYYIYANSQPIDQYKAMDEDGNPVHYEKTAPILLAVKDAKVTGNKKDLAKANGRTVIYAQGADADGSTDLLSQYDPEAVHNSSNLGKGENANVTYYKMNLVTKQLSGNDDLNYVIRTMEDDREFLFVPGRSDAFQFVDVNGVQTWDAYGNDMLNPNTWSNYYSTIDNDADDLSIEIPDAEYFRLVLATNPDAARYQILSRQNSMISHPALNYSNQNVSAASDNDAPAYSKALDNDPDDSYIYDGEGIKVSHKSVWIYPTTSLKGSFFWDNLYDRIDISLTISDEEGNVTQIDEAGYFTMNLDQDGNPVFKYKGEVIPEDKISIVTESDAFLRNTEYLFTYEFGDYFVDPAWTIEAVASYRNMDSDKAEELQMAKVTLQTGGYYRPAVQELNTVEYNGGYNWQDKPMYFEAQELYLAQLEWNNDEHNTYDGLPRKYVVTGQETVENLANADEAAAKGELFTLDTIDHDGYVTYDYDGSTFNHHYNTYFWWNRNNEVEFYGYKMSVNEHGLPVLSDVNEVHIRYTVTPVYHYAVPVTKNKLFKAPKSLDYLFDEIPAGTEDVIPAASYASNENKITKEYFLQKTVKGESASVIYTFSTDGGTATEVEEIEMNDNDATVEIYSLQGVRVNGQPEPGIYIIRQGNSTRKVVIK